MMKNCLKIFACLLILVWVSPICHAQASKPPVGILIYKGSPGDSAEYYSGVLYWSAEYQGARYAFDTRQGKPFVIFRDLIASVAEFEIPGKGNVYQINIETDADVETIESFSQSLTALVAPSPKLAAVINPVRREFESWITNFRGGNVRINGVWKSSLDMAAETAARLEKTVIIAGISYESVQISGFQNGILRFTHGGGVASVHASKLSAEEKALISSRFGVDALALKSIEAGPATMPVAAVRPDVPAPRAQASAAGSANTAQDERVARILAEASGQVPAASQPAAAAPMLQQAPATAQAATPATVATPERTAIYEAKGIGGNLEAARENAESLCLSLAAADCEAFESPQKTEHFIKSHSQNLRKEVIKAVRKLASKHDAKGVTIIIQAEIVSDKLNAKIAENQ